MTSEWMPDIALLLKSYGPDLPYASRLVESFDRYNVEKLTMYVVVPGEDLEMFQHLTGEHVQVLDESVFAHHLVDATTGGMRPGYINQEIIKLAFWELGLARNYFCVDSDAMFIRPIRSSDFLAPDGYPYTVLVEDLELKVEPRYFDQYWRERGRSLRLIQSEIGLDAPVVLTCHGHQIFSATVLQSFVNDFLTPRGWDYRDALAVAPYEFSWYNFWLQKSGVIPIHPREPLVKVFHHEGQHFEYILRGIGLADLARGYLAVVVNSNFTRDLGLINVDASKPVALSPYLSYREVGQLLGAKARGSLGRLFQRR